MPQTAGEMLLNVVAQGIRGGKQKKQNEAFQTEISNILGGGGTREEMLKAFGGAQNPALQQYAISEMLKTPKAAGPMFGGSFSSKLLETAFTKPGTEEGRLAYQQLTAPKTIMDQATGNVTQITPSVPAMLTSLYAQAPGAAPGEGLAVDAGGPVVPGVPQQDGGFEDVGAGVRVKEGYGKSATADESKSTGFANRMLDSEAIYEDLIAKGFDPSTKTTAFFEGLEGSSFTPDLVAQSALPQDVKRYIGGKLDFITAVLRKESGAAIGQTEYEKENKKYFPQAGDGPDVLADKKQRRLNALQSMGKAAGRRYQKDFPEQYKTIFDGAAGATEAATDIPQSALDYLKENDSPELRKQFEAKYGKLPAGL